MFDIKSVIEEISYPSPNDKPAIYFKVESTCKYITYTKEYPSNRFNRLTATEENEKSLEDILMSMAKNDIRM